MKKGPVILENSYLEISSIMIFLGLCVILLLATESMNRYASYATCGITILLWLMFLIRKIKYYPDKVEAFFPFRFKKVVTYLDPTYTIVYHNIKARNSAPSLYFVNSESSKGEQIRDSLLYGISPQIEDEVLSYVSEILKNNISVQVKTRKIDFPEFIKQLKLKTPNIIVKGDTISLQH
jgi:hypothetical protein